MNKHLIILIFLAIFIVGCKSDFDILKDNIYKYASNDNIIDQKEFESLIEQINLSNEKSFQMFKSDNGNINNDLVVNYLIKYLSAKKMNLLDSDIWHPNFIDKNLKKFNINVFLENSASMDGYVEGVTDFETSIYNLLGDFKISGICDSLNLNYINKSIPFTKKNAFAPDIQDFIEKLDPSTFKQRGGNRNTSDLKNILNTVLKTIDEKNAAVLISDFVFSPGRNSNAQDYLNNQGVGIKIDFAEKIKTFDLSAVIIQLQSNFGGIYYDKTDKQISLNCKRPYYIWILGSTNQIKEILNNKILDNIKGGYLNRLVLQQIKLKQSQPNFKILPHPRIGEFDLSLLADKIITSASTSNDIKHKGVFEFTTAIDFNNSLQDKYFYNDSNNYQCSDNNYSLKPEIIVDKNISYLNGYSHLIKLNTSNLIDETIKIDIIGKTPSWVYNSTSDDDANIFLDNSEKQKTFGFKYLVEGVCDAFYPKSKSNIINSISITIKK